MKDILKMYIFLIGLLFISKACHQGNSATYVFSTLFLL